MPEPVLLVHMPYADLERPSLGLGLLKSSLARAGIPCRVVYANLLFAERVGLERWRLLRQIPEQFLAGEWTFSRAAFPDFAEPPGFLEQLYRRSGFQVDLEPVRRLAEAFVEELSRELTGHRVVGCTSTFQQHCASLALLRRLKELDPSVVTVLGGANCEGSMGEAALGSFPWLDVVVSGEADLLMPELVRSLLEGAWDDVPYGAITRARLGRGAPRARVEELDRLPVPDFDDYFEALGRSPLGPAVGPGLVMESSRGCWWGAKHHCTFCGLNGTGMGYRTKSAERVLEEMEYLSGRHDLQAIEMVDNILDVQAFRSYLPRLAAREPKFSIFYEVKANLSREQMELLVDAGVGWVQPGLESMHDEVLKLLDKGTTALQNVRFLRWARELGMRVTWLMLTQVPGERDEWYQEMASWLPLISHLQPPARAVWVRYDRFSPYQQRPEDFGLVLVPDPSYRFVYPPEVDLANLAYFFDDAPGSAPPGREDSRPGLSELHRVVMGWVSRFWRLPDLLCMSQEGDRLRILDTRPVRLERDVWLEGAEREVLLACEAGRTRAWLGRHLGPVDGAVDELVRRRLLLELGGKLLALPVRGSVPRLPSRDDFPGGRTLAVAAP